MSRKVGLAVFGLFAFLQFSGCVTTPPPIEDYTLARAALEAARAVEAARFSAGNLQQAEELFRKAQILYDEREFAAGRDQFVKARLAAEKAENSTRLLRQKTGEIL